jgi:hypothetical protein
MNIKRFQFVLVIFSIFSVTGIASASSSITTVVDGRSGPWISALNPSFSWGASILPPAFIDSATGLSMNAGDTLTISYISGTTNGGGPGIFSDANGNQAYAGDLAGVPATPPFGGPPSLYTTSQGPVYFMALLGAFTDSHGVIVGSPFKIGNGPLSETIPEGASRLSMGFNDGGGGFFDNSGGIIVGVTEVSTIPEPETYAMFIAGLGLMGFMARRRNTA